MFARDIPQSVLYPAGWNQWRVVAYTGKRGDIQLGETFVRADSESAACELGKTALRLIGVRGRFVVNAKPYYPWFDPAMLGYIYFVR